MNTPLAILCIIVFAFAALRWFGPGRFLGSLTPAGIVLLNLAVNMAPLYGVLPVSLAFVVYFLPMPEGPARIVVSLLVLYAPSILALVLLRKGPPGNPVLRFLLGLWVCYVAIAATLGPGRHLLEGFRAGDASTWLPSALAGLAILRLALLVVNIAAMFLAPGREHGMAIARSIRVDSTRVLVAIALGAAFWFCVRGLRALDMSPDTVGAIILAAPFAIDALLSLRHGPADTPAPADERLERASGWFTALTIAVVAVIAVVGVGFFVLRAVFPDLRDRSFVNPVTGMPVDMKELQAEAAKIPWFTVWDSNAEVHERVRQLLERDGIAYQLYSAGGREMFRVDKAHRAAVDRILAEIEGPPLPEGSRYSAMDSAAAAQAFGAWLARKGVASQVVTKRERTYVAWEPVEQQSWIESAYRESMKVSSRELGVDYFAIEVIARRAGETELDRDHIAAFESDEHRDRFEAWLRRRRIEPRRVTHAGREFVAWTAVDTRFWDYRSPIRDACFESLKRRPGVTQTELSYNNC